MSLLGPLGPRNSEKVIPWVCFHFFSHNPSNFHFLFHPPTPALWGQALCRLCRPSACSSGLLEWLLALTAALGRRSVFPVPFILVDLC